MICELRKVESTTGEKDPGHDVPPGGLPPILSFPNKVLGQIPLKKRKGSPEEAI